MKYAYSLGLFLIFLSISNNKIYSENSRLNDSISGDIQIDNSVDFLAEFKNIEANGLHIFTVTYDREGNLIKSPFGGHTLDVKKYRYLDNKSIFFNIEAVRKGNSHIYAIGKFKINEKYIGLLIRQDSQYDESLIEIVIWDKYRRSIISSLFVADSFGDENWRFNMESWIKDFQFNKDFNVISWKRDKYSKENCIYPKNCDSLALDTFRISRLQGFKFNTMILEQLDTIEFRLKYK